jgi:hypothetical protein
MNREKAKLHYLAGIINESQYHEIFGFDLLSTKKEAKNKILGFYNIDIEDNSMHIYPVKSIEGLSPTQAYLARNSSIDTHLALSDEQMQEFVDAMGDDLFKDKYENFKDRGIHFKHRIGDTTLKLSNNVLQFDDGFDRCYDFNCQLTLKPDQLNQLKK